MSFTANSGRIRVTDANGVEKLDTDDDLFHVVGAGIAGTIDIPGIQVLNGNPQNSTTEYTLGSCNTACTHVIGAVRFFGEGAWAIGFNRWTTYMGGHLVWLFSAGGITAGTVGTINDNVKDICIYRFYVSGGLVRLERRLIFQDPPGSVFRILKAHSIQYKLKPGLFT